MEHPPARPVGAHRAGAQQWPRPGQCRGSHLGIPAPVGARGGIAHVRQQHLPGPPLPGAADAAAGGLVPLPQPRREHAQGAGQALETGDPRRLREEEQPSGHGRHSRVHRRTGLVPGAPAGGLISAVSVHAGCAAAYPAYDPDPCSRRADKRSASANPLPRK